MKICVAGLGIIGGSMCMALKRADYEVYGYNRSQKPVEYALEHGIIDGAVSEFTVFDVVFVALPPKATVDFINAHKFKKGAIVADICGVKKYIEDEIYKMDRNFRYVGCHPMAGKEVAGIQNASEKLFDGASMIVTSCDKTDSDAYDTVISLATEMGFGRIVECSAEFHDRKIAYTSQLAHIVSNAYVKDADAEDCIGFTGGSFQDMTRIAGVDEGVWSELYLKNRKNVSDKISALITSLTEIKEAVDSGDENQLKEVLKVGREQFENIKNSKRR